MSPMFGPGVYYNFNTLTPNTLYLFCTKYDNTIYILNLLGRLRCMFVCTEDIRSSVRVVGRKSDELCNEVSVYVCIRVGGCVYT